MFAVRIWTVQPKTNKPTVCAPQRGMSYARAVLKDATSLEAYVAPRLEFGVAEGRLDPAQVYATARLGFIALADAPRVTRTIMSASG